jgi:predicted homoserine dehydrogenase-like protein
MSALPIGLSEGRILLRDVPKDSVVSFEDVGPGADGLVESLWREQNARWPNTSESMKESSLEPAEVGRGR